MYLWSTLITPEKLAENSNYTVDILYELSRLPIWWLKTPNSIGAVAADRQNTWAVHERATCAASSEYPPFVSITAAPDRC